MRVRLAVNKVAQGLVTEGAAMLQQIATDATPQAREWCLGFLAAMRERGMIPKLEAAATTATAAGAESKPQQK